MNNYEIEVLKYYCAEHNIKFDKRVADTDQFKAYALAWAKRLDRKQEIEMNEYENKFVEFVKKVVDEADKGITVEIVAEHEQQRKGMRKSLNNYLKATRGHTALMKNIKIVTKEWKDARNK